MFQTTNQNMESITNLGPTFVIFVFLVARSTLGTCPRRPSRVRVARHDSILRCRAATA